MLKKLWWWVKVRMFPSLDRRAKPRARKMQHADDMLKTAIIDFIDAVKGGNDIHFR